MEFFRNVLWKISIKYRFSGEGTVLEAINRTFHDQFIAADACFGVDIMTGIDLGWINSFTRAFLDMYRLREDGQSQEDRRNR